MEQIAVILTTSGRKDLFATAAIEIPRDARDDGVERWDDIMLPSHVSRLTSHVSRLTSHVSRLTSHVSRLNLKRFQLLRH